MAYRIALHARPQQFCIYSGRSFLATDLGGCVTGRDVEGFYYENTRLLARDELTVGGKQLKAVAASPVEGDSLLAYVEVPDGPGVPAQAVFLEIARFVGEGMWTTYRARNYAPRDVARFALTVHLAADFADQTEVERGKREQTGQVETSWDQEHQELLFRYHHPDLDRAVAVHVVQAPSPARFEHGALVLGLNVQPHETAEVHLAVEPIFGGRRRTPTARTFGEAESALARLRQQLRDEVPVLTTTNDTVARAWRTATFDLASLPLGLPDGPSTPIAGLPLYQQFFGRDTLTIGWQALLATPTLLRDTLSANAAWQGTAIDDWFDEEPGKMIHQARWGPLSVLGVDPFQRYYGDYATPADFLIMLGQYYLWTNNVESCRRLLPAARSALDWLERFGDLDGDGFLEYVTRSPKGVKNQGWKDSGEAIVDERGDIVENPIATSELQAYWYAGLQQAAFAFLAAGDVGYALELFGKARDLKRRFDQAFWMEDHGFYALALGPDKRPVRSIASNAGHLLAAGIVPVRKGKRVAQRLMEPDMFSGWGIRTLSSNHVSYNPFSYHLGSVWPVENGTFALGFGRYGCLEELHRLAEGLFAATDLFVANRLPEALGGHPRDALHPHPGIYPKSNEPQGWSASAIVILIQALLGMRPVAPFGLLLVDPHLPPWLPDLRLQGIRVGRAQVDLEFRRTTSGETEYQVTRRAGNIRVLRQPPPDAPTTTMGSRLGTAIASLLFT